MKGKSKNKQGISLIVLVITIIVMIILAAAVILSLSSNGIIDRANEVVTDTNLSQVQTLASTIWAEIYLENIEGKNLSYATEVPKRLKEKGIDITKYDIVADGSGVTVKLRSEETAIPGCPIRFGQPYSIVDEGTTMSLVVYTDGRADVYVDAQLMESIPIGTLTYDMCNILMEGDVFATSSEDGTQIDLDGMILTLDTSWCPHGVTVTQDNNIYCAICDELLLEGCPIHFGKSYGHLNNDTLTAYVFYLDGNVAVYTDGQLEGVLGAGTVTYDGCNILIGGSVLGTASEDGTQIVILGTTYKLGIEPCPHTSTEIRNAIEATCVSGYSGDEYCIECGKLMVGGEITEASNNHIDNGSGVCQTCGISKIPNGATYFVGVTSDTLGDYTGATASYTAGDWFPETSSKGDVYILEDYEYRYQYHAAWYARVLDNTKSAYRNVVPIINNSPTELVNTYYECTNLISVTIPDGVTTIGQCAFWGCASLTNITISDSVTSIGGNAFWGCTSLTSITIPASVTTIDCGASGAFLYCTSLTSITVESGNTVYHSSGNCIIKTASQTLVAGCKNSAIPADGSVTSIGNFAFHGCTSLTSITIPDSVTSIGQRAFAGCTSLSSVTIPDGVISIGVSAFSFCSGLTSVTFGENSQLTSIVTNAFDCCTNLTSITIPDSVTSIVNNAFAGCTSLTSITIPDSVTSIGNFAFLDCMSLTSITFEGTVEQWNAISKDSSWNYDVPATEVVCSDSTVSLV